jgi:small GTP-binding protein
MTAQFGAVMTPSLSMSKSIVALVGRPNVGKSTLFNRLVGERLSIVADQAGTTRDRVQAPCEWNGVEFTLVDTGGIEPLEALRNKDTQVLATASKDFVHEIREQAEMAIAEADVLVFTVDAQVGLTGTDEAVVEILRKLVGQRQRQGKSVPPILVAASKAESQGPRIDSLEFYKLGLGDVYPVSGIRGDGTGDLLDAVVKAIPPEEPKASDDTLKIALVGRPNVGKSSLFNMLIGEDRVIVSNVPGTTRDAIDTVIEYRPGFGSSTGDMAELGDAAVANGRAAGVTSIEQAGDDETVGDADEIEDDADDQGPATPDLDDTYPALDGSEDEAVRTNDDPHAPVKITLIDTAGIRKRGSVEPGIEKFSVLRSFKAIARSDIALLLIDAVDGVTAQDEHVAGYVLDENKSVIVLVNKWDLVESPEKVARVAKHVPGWGMITPKMQEYIDALQKRFNFMPYVPILFISAKLGFRCEAIFPTAIAVNEARNMRITTSQLMHIVREASLKHSPPLKAGRRLKVYMAQQASVNPPTFVFHVNDIKLVHFGYERYLENRIRDDFGFLGTPLRLLFRGHKEE